MLLSVKLFYCNHTSFCSCFFFSYTIQTAEQAESDLFYLTYLFYSANKLPQMSVVLTDRKYFWAALHFYSIANFVASWLRWLQMTSNDFTSLIRHTETPLESFFRSFRVIWVQRQQNYLSHKHATLLKIALSFFVPSWR